MDENMETFVNAIQSLTEIKEENLTDEVMVAVQENFKQQLSPQMVKQAVNEMIKNMEEQGLTKEEAADAVKAIKDLMNEMVYGEQQYTGNKKKLIDDIIQSTYSIFDQAVEQYHSYNIVLPMTLEEGAKEPTYAHESDAAADLYALEDTDLNAHTYGNKIRTGVHIQLPEGWLAMILPRSSIGAKTPFRLSNSVGLIDSGYRGELGVLYDNTSDTNSFIRKGDRIAQLLVMPSYRFKAEIVESLEDSDRGTGGFGSTGA
jgi:dUTP pyrophosphatase